MDRDLYYATLKEVYEHLGGPVPVTAPLKEVAEYLGFDPRTLMATRSFPLRKNGNRYYVVKTALASWMSREAV